tara:strand:+ start:217 stop:1431 length:1215 start_codon:yes stop_codon:yes gene_type:complete
MISVSDARKNILADQALMPSELVSLNEALGRVLAEDIVARRSQPPISVSAMDGYAVIAKDVEHTPVTLQVIDTIAAGRTPTKSIKTGEAIRIFTGAPIPQGADAVVIQENTDKHGDNIIVKESVTTGRYIRPEGLDFKQGSTLLTTGKVLTSRDVGLIAAMNVSWVKVKRRPIVAIIATGDEIVLPGENKKSSDIVSSNTFALAGLINVSGGTALTLGIAKDEIQSIRDISEGAQGADILVTTGGASVGEHDLIQSALTEIGLKIKFWKIAMRPGKPLIYGRLNNIPMLGFPGNPVSSMVCAILFLKPVLAAMLGLAEIEPKLENGLLGKELEKNDHREEYLRATISIDERGNKIITPFPVQDSSMFSRLAMSDCLLVRPPNAEKASINDSVSYIDLNTGMLKI